MLQRSASGLQETLDVRAVLEMHQQMKEELGLDHFEGRSWHGLHHRVDIHHGRSCGNGQGVTGLQLRREGFEASREKRSS